MESAEREALFEQYRAEGWEKEYARYRADWVSLAKERRVSDYPLLVDCELSTACNLSCPMCYTITDEFKKKIRAAFMDFGLFKKIIDEIAGKVPALRLSLRGEPTLHKNFIECIQYAKNKGIKEISFLTNAGTLSAENFEKMMDAGADWITVSIDGLSETYESIRRPLKFRETLEKIKKIKEIKEKRGVHKPVIKVQSVWPAVRDNPEEYYDTFEPYVDMIAFNPIIDYLKKDDEIIYDENFSCPQLYQRLVIGADGRAMMCSNDEDGEVIIGDANEESIHEIWHGAKLSEIRNIHNENSGFKKITPCVKCYLPRKTEAEKSSIHGREFMVENYVNREQKIGS